MLYSSKAGRKGQIDTIEITGREVISMTNVNESIVKRVSSDEQTVSGFSVSTFRW